jgi:hypothetical protein
MRVTIMSSVISQLAGAAAVIWMCGASPTWAGDGGASLQTLQAILSDPSSGLCVTFGINPCPQLPTITQAVLEVANIENSPPEMVRALNSIPPGSWVDAGNAAALPPKSGVPITFPLTASTSPTLSNLLSTLTPLAFISSERTPFAFTSSQKNNQATASAAQLYDPEADTFLYAVTSGASIASTGLTIPDTAYFFYDDLSRINTNFLRGQTVAKFSLPLTVLNGDGTERAVATTLQFIAPAADCSASTVTGDFLNTGTPQTRKATDIGLKCAVVFGSSPTSPAKHAIFELAIPLIVIEQTPLQTPDLTYFWFASGLGTGPVNFGIPSAFFPPNVTGFTPAKGILDSAGTSSIGIAPSAGPLGPPPSCSGTNCTPPPSTFALCASLPRNINFLPLVPSVAADYGIATSGETRLSAPLPSVSTSTCPF